ncbi:uncharacterized protein LOC121858091 [Homarus americanus]|uniref:Lipocalin n=1 Tax=Homarus americanus TaxID=6706 RepID=A0A8J5N9C0_HOMAM|nr:uncharacterized protein LOC121858091 [Homarus americanus]KAG7175526.1 hypothetical protein Hamer_G022063 [Homarus americanus]
MKVSVCVVLLLILSSMAEGVQEEGDGKEAKFFIKSYSTTTWTFLSSFTSTVPYTCYLSDDAAGDCATGRRLRRSKKLSLNHEATVTDLLSSTDEGSLDVLDGLSNQEEKLFFTLWKTSSSTVTVTTFSTNRSVTISASLMCVYPGLVVNQC